MDPFSIATGMITFVSAANTLLVLCYKIQATVRDPPWMLTRLVQEIKELRNLVESVHGAVSASEIKQKEDPKATNFDLYQSMQAPLADCLTEVRTLERSLAEYSQASTNTHHECRFRNLIQALKWMLDQESVQTSLSKIERCKNALMLCINSQNMITLTNVEKITISTHLNTERTCSQIERITELFTQSKLNAEEQMIMGWLSHLKPWYNHEMALQAHEYGTNEWVFETEQFQNWTTSHKNFLWITGPPGSGKTVLLSHIIEHTAEVHQSEGNISCPSVYAVMYCDYKNQDCQSIEDVLGLLLGQIYSQIGKVPHDIVSEYRRCSKPPRFSRPGTATLVGWLKEASRKAKVCIIVDALDEHILGYYLFHIMQDLANEFERPRIIVSSRPNLELHAETNSARLRLEDYVSEVDNDIRRYVLARLSKDPKLKKWSLEKYCALISDGILSQSNGMFRWASCQIDAISRVRTLREVKRVIASLPAGLEDTYKRTIGDVSSQDSELLRKMLMWLSLSMSTLTEEELLEAVAIQPWASAMDEDCQLEGTEDLLSLGNSLVSISKGRVHLAHLSVRDYLLSESLKRDSRLAYFALVPGRSHAELAADCITYLFFDELRSGPCDSSDEYMARLWKMPFLKYASNCWSYHLRAAEVDESLSHLVLKLFLPEYHSTFMSWIQVIHTESDSNFKWNIYPRHATPLYYAASYGLRDVVKHFLGNGLALKDLNAPGSRFGGTALHAATIRNHFDVMEDLLQAGADPSTADFNKVTPLHSAASQGSVKATNILLRFGASIGARDCMTDMTPLQWARQSAQMDVALLLEAAETRSSGHMDSGSAESMLSSTQSRQPTGSQRKTEPGMHQDEITIWQPVPGFFPDHYEKRSGLDSSAILSFTVGDEITVLQSPLDYIGLLGQEVESKPKW